MPGTAELLPVGTQDLGVLPRKGREDYLPAIEWHDQHKRHALIKPDENNEYTITESLIKASSHCALYDNQTKILEWHYGEDGRLIVQSYTEKQVNLFAALKVKECLIKAQGPLFFKGKLDSEATVAIDAEALWLADAVTSEGTIVLNTRQGVGLLAPVNGQHLVINASYIHQEADLQLSGQLDVSTQCFKQDASVKTSVTSLRFIAAQCEMRGELTVNRECFLTSTILVWGHETAQSTFRFSGDNHIHARYLQLHGDTQARIGNLEGNKEGSFIVDQELLVDEIAVAHFFNTKCSINKTDNQGELLFDQCSAETQFVKQSGIFDAHQSLLTVAGEFTQHNHAFTELKDCVFNASLTNVCGGEFFVSDTAYKGQFCKVYAGFLALQNRSEIEIEKLFLAREARSIVHDCNVKAHHSIEASGELSFESTDVETTYLKTINGKFTSKKSTINADALVQLRGVTELAESHIVGKTMTLDGELSINKAQLNADSLKIISQKATINLLFSHSGYLQLQGSENAEQVVFKGCGLTTQLLSCLDHITFDSSTFYGVSEKKIIHDLRAHLKLNNAKFITEDHIRNYMNGEIELENNSIMKVRLLHSQGAMKAKDSQLFCEILWQENAALELESSAVKIRDELRTKASKLVLNKGSVILAASTQLREASALNLNEGSTLISQSGLVNSSDSTITSTDSRVFAKKFKAYGRTELCSSLLLADELLIYDGFAANSMSEVTVDGLIVIALEGHARLENSAVAADTLTTFGRMDVSNSALVTKEDVQVFSSATLTLEGRSKVEAENMLVRGTLDVQDKPEVDSGKQQEKTISLIKVNKELHAAEAATIKGTSDLLIEAEKYVHSGTTNFTGKLSVTGGMLTNHGSWEARSLYLGLDDQVRNFGSFSAENMTTHSNFLNLMGQVYARKSLSVAGFYGVNSGLIAANNYSNSTLLSVNGGLVLPNFSADPQHLFTWGNFAAVGKIALTTLFPGYSNAVNLGFMGLGLWYNEPSLYNRAKDFNLDSMTKDFNWKRYRSMRRHELMAELCQLKGLASTAYSAFNMAYSIPGELSSLSKDYPAMKRVFDLESYSYSHLKSAASQFDYQNFGRRSASIVLGNYFDDSLVNINLGLSVAPTTKKRSLFSINTGAECSLLSHNVENLAFFNSGWSGGSEACFSTRYAYNTGGIQGVNRFLFNAGKTVNKGNIRGNNAYVAIDRLTQEGQFDLSNGQARIEEFNDNRDAVTEYSDMWVTGTSYGSEGHFAAQRARFIYIDKFRTYENSTANTSQVFIGAQEFSLGGQLAHQDGLVIEADKAVLAEDSIVTGKQTSKDELFVPKAEIPKEQTASTGEQPMSGTDAATVDVEKEFKPQHILQIHAREVVFDGKMSGGDYTQIQGKTAQSTASTQTGENKETTVAKFEKMTVEEHADIKLTNGSIEGIATENSGQLELSKFSLNMHELEQNAVMRLDDCVGEISEVTDSVTATTAIEGYSSLKGTSFVSVGGLTAQSTRFNYTDEFVTGETSQFKTDNVHVATGHFEVGGKVDYQNALSVSAERAHLKAGSVINGKQTAEDELFVAKEETATQSGNTPALEKEFKPQNTFAIEAEKVKLDGAIKGGDYTSIKGVQIEKAEGVDAVVEKCETLEVGESADIDLTYGSIAAKSGDISGLAHLKNFDVTLDKTRVDQDGQLSLEKSALKGTALTNVDGTLSLDNSVVALDEMNLSTRGRETIKDSTITTGKLIDNSQLLYQGQAALFTESYEHGGKVTFLSAPHGGSNNGNLFYVKSKTADLHGASAIDNAVFDIEHFAHATQFTSGLGRYGNYGVTSNLELDTLDYMTLNSPFYRDCNLTVKASGITMTADYNRAKDLSLISTVGDVSLLSTIINNNLYVKSAGSIRTNHTLYSNGLANFEASGGFYNLGGTVNANTVAIKASTIKNVSAGSHAASVAWGVPMGNAGIINGRTDAYLEATAANIENYGGIIRSGNYTQLIARGSVLNQCNIGSYQGAYDLITTYNGGLIAGGSGVGTNGIGLYIKADGQVYSDASNFVSNGVNYIEGDKGLEFAARQETHISNITTTKNWYGKTTRHVTMTTTVTNSMVHSAIGQNILVTKHGGVKSVATRFSSPGGTQIYARDNVDLYSLRTESRDYQSTRSLWGLSKHSRLQIDQESTPTLFIDNGVTRIHSSEGSIDARGAYFTGAGDLDLRAHGRIKFGVDILDHDVVEKTRRLGLSVPGMGAWQAWKSTGNLMDTLTAEDATLAKLNSMLSSNNTSELLANSANLGINLYNTTNGIMRGLGNDNLTSELLARYGLGGANGFSPTITLSMTESRTTAQYQTQGVGGVNRGGDVYLEASEGIDLENGVRVHAGGDMEVNAPELIAKAAELHSCVDQKTTAQSLGLSLTGELQDASVGYSHQKTQATHYVNAELSANGNMDLNYQGEAMHHVRLDGGRIEARTLDAKIEKLDVIDKQDLTVTQTEFASVSLSGQVSAYKGKGTSAITTEHSAIHVIEGINNNGHSVHVDEASMHGGEILTEGVNTIQIDRLVTEQVVDHQSYSGIGISLNVNDLQRLTGQKATNETGEQAIAVAEMSFDRIDYKAEKTAVIHGTQGTQAPIKELVGELHTESVDGTKVIKQDELHLTLDIPVTNSDYLEKSRANIQAGLDKISIALGINEVPEVEIPLLDEKTLPSRRKDDDEEEEEEEEIDNSLEKDKTSERKESASEREKSAEEKIVFSPEEEKALLEAAFSLIPSEEQEQIKILVSELENKRKQTGKVDPKSQMVLQQQIKSAILQVFKAASEDSWGRLSKQLGPGTSEKLGKILSSPDAASKLGIKTYLGTKGVFITFAFNLGLKSVDGDKDLLKEAITDTAGDISFGILLSYTAGSLAGPINWTFVGLGIADSFLYDEKSVDQLFKDSLSRMREGQKLLDQGALSEGLGAQITASAQLKLASQAQAAHYLLTWPSYFAKPFSYVWDKVAGKREIPEAPQIPTPAPNRNSFFSQTPGKSGDQKKENVVKESYSQQEKRSW
ncbi:hypothetical protein [Legionella feeleii]|uniref:Type V secretory pathway, adhesin AidA n=2 Tax=Legionella TaxID=445 RepID=A0A0W0TMK4_9GAMM|nr:hypothetical protein [Legionella feeleii]KTC96765.1 hypothetical protein Lfee_1677 [Legionella feeleii]SPX60563.1 Type V secretory pathway, adhesin AidA [Legionella feeleii]